MNTLEKKIRVLLLGESFHTKEFRDQINEHLEKMVVAEYREFYTDNINFKNIDIIHLISTPLTLIKKLLRYKKPVFYHWIGTDVYRFSKDSFLKKYMKKLLINSTGVYNLVVSEKLKEELGDLGISSVVIPLVKLNFVADCPSFPEKFSVLTYLPKSRWEFYRGDMILEVAGSLPMVDFHVLSSGNIPNKPVNVCAYDFVEDMYSFYKRCNILLRITEHDGLAKMVLEALSYGRHVMWSSPFPHSHLVGSVEKSIETIKFLKNNFGYNLEGKKFVELNYNSVNICADYLRMCKKMVSSNG